MINVLAAYLNVPASDITNYSFEADFSLYGEPNSDGFVQSGMNIRGDIYEPQYVVSVKSNDQVEKRWVLLSDLLVFLFERTNKLSL